MSKAPAAVLLFLAIGLLLSGPASAQTAARPDAGKFLPREVLGWMAEPADQLFDAETIFDYIDGAGEVYRAYNMKGLVSRKFLKQGGPAIIADLFDMGSSADAFGVFSHDLDGEDWSLGQASLYKGGLLNIWQDCYFAALYAEDETDETKAALREMGRRLVAALPGGGAKPDLLAVLPAGYDDPKRVRFLHSPVILNYHFFLASENILGLDERTDVVLAAAADKSVLLAVRYPTPARAEPALRAFRAALMPGTNEGRAYRSPAGTWTAAGLAGG
ncbi:MAG: hypothetical protein NTZ26_05040, partial [Candidatus Aminicenantes bacterium]|nr:hypothetical protein [Candidatus Aminicenantes bacterium]